MYIYICIYIYMCVYYDVCVCVSVSFNMSLLPTCFKCIKVVSVPGTPRVCFPRKGSGRSPAQLPWP